MYCVQMVVRGSVIAHEAILQPWSFLIHADNFYSAVQRCVTTGIFGIFNFRTTWTPSATRFFHLLTSKLNEIASELIISIVYLRACNRWAVHSRTGTVRFIQWTVDKESLERTTERIQREFEDRNNPDCLPKILTRKISNTWNHSKKPRKSGF